MGWASHNIDKIEEWTARRRINAKMDGDPRWRLIPYDALDDFEKYPMFDFEWTEAQIALTEQRYSD